MNRLSPSPRRILLLFVLFLLLLLPQRSSAQTKSFRWERFDVDMAVLENGDVRIVERQTLNFSGAPFTFGFGVIYTGQEGNNDGITDIRVSENGRSYSQSGSQAPGTFTVERSSDEVEIRWYFEPALGTHTYTFAYTVAGAVQVGEQIDELFWKAVPSDHQARIEASTVTVRLPEGVQIAPTNNGSYLVQAYIDEEEEGTTPDNPGAGRVRMTVDKNGRSATFQSSSLAPGEQLEVRVALPHGQLPIETPGWQRRAQINDAVGLTFLAIALLVFIGGPLVALLLWYLRGRDPETGVVVPDYISEPPDDLPPAVAGALTDEKADMSDIVSTVIDLAGRGYLTMAEEKRDKHRFRRTDKPDDDLRPFEREFLRSVFRGKEERTLESLRYKFADKLPKLRGMLYEELEDRQLIRRNPQTVRNSYGCLAGVVFGVGAIGLVAVPAVFSDVETAVCLPLSLAPGALVLAIVSRFMPAKTKTGAEAAAKWKAFKEYLKNVDRYQDLQEATDIFETYLPYATAFGLERTWIRKFSAVPHTPIPPWYYPYGYGHAARRVGRRQTAEGNPSGEAGPAAETAVPTLEGMSGSLSGGLESMSSSLTRMLNSTATILKSQRPSSTGGGSFSGGGFSGGGRFSSGGGGSRGFG